MSISLSLRFHLDSLSIWNLTLHLSPFKLFFLLLLRGAWMRTHCFHSLVHSTWVVSGTVWMPPLPCVLLDGRVGPETVMKLEPGSFPAAWRLLAELLQHDEEAVDVEEMTLQNLPTRKSSQVYLQFLGQQLQ